GMHVTLGDEDLSAGQGKITIEDEQHVVVTDHYVSLSGGRPTKLERSFDELSGKSRSKFEFEGMGGEEGGPEEDANDESSSLQGKSVTFAWDKDAEKYDLAFAEGKGDEDLLKDLEEDMDLRGILPTKSVSQGDSWDLDAKLFQHVLSPGGDLKIATE